MGLKIKRYVRHWIGIEPHHVLTLRAPAVRKKAQPPFDLPPLSGSN
jgi:hypothetical protein